MSADQTTEELLPCPFDEWFERRFKNMDLMLKDEWKQLAREAWGAALNTRPSQWRSDMENAPRDGVEILTHDDLMGYQFCFWAEFEFDEQKQVGWTDGYMPVVFDGPTHWMPLPTPPEEGK